MSKAKFTKGEWEVEDKFILDDCYLIASNLTGFGVCGTIRKGETDKANAHLIACAPEMYKELQEVSNWLNSQLGMGDWHKDIEKLLAKARGEQ